MTVDTIAADTVAFEVTDHGDGVPPDFAGQMFERFTRADQTKHLQGTGIGLSIVAGLAAANGGSVRYTPTQPSGATFTIELPRATTPG